MKEFTSLTPVSKIQLNQGGGQQSPVQPQSVSERPLERPTLVRPQRTSTVLIQNNEVNQDQLLLMQRQMSSPSVVDPSMMVHYQQQQQQQQQVQQPQQPQQPQPQLQMQQQPPQIPEQPYYQQQNQYYDPMTHAQSKGIYRG